MAGWEHLAAMLPAPPQATRESIIRGAKKPGKPGGFRWTIRPYKEENGGNNF
jgi:hypothetical protein